METAARLVNRPAPPVPAAAPAAALGRAPAGVVQCQPLRVSSPADGAEVEAERVARQIVSMPAPAYPPRPAVSMAPPVARLAPAIVQRQAAAPRPGGAAAGPVPSGEIAQAAGGETLPGDVLGFMQPRFGADFRRVRIHTDERAARLARQINAKAFTVGERIFFGQNQFRPDTGVGRELIAHELTHTIQQGAATQPPTLRRSPDIQVNTRSAPEIQRGWLPDPMEYIAGKANSIPGFTLFTVVIGYNPITRAGVDRSAGNILQGAIELIPGGSFITEALNNHGIFARISTWTQTQFDAVKDIGSTIWSDIKDFVKGLKLSDATDLSGVWERGKRIITGPVNQVMAFAKGLKDGIVGLVKDAILKPIGAYARGTDGYPLLCSVMGKDPITGEAAPQDPEALMGAFMKFIGETETWENMKKANAIPRAFAWFKGAVAALKGFVAEIPGLFVAAFKSLEIMDIVLIPRAFVKLAKVFGGFAGRFVSWGLEAVWNLLEIIFDSVKPGIMGYVKRTGGALKSILKNPLPFVGNLVAAGKLGFQQFAGNFGKHLKAGLIEWLTGSLPGVYIPASFELKEIVKFALSVLGISWQNIRGKLVKVVGETAVKAMEAGFSLVVTLVREGPAAAWEQLKAQLASLRDSIVGGIVDMVVGLIVQKAIPKVIAMFIPGAGFIGAILSIYDTVMVFVQKLAKIAAVVGAFVNSIVQIAAGNIGGAAKRVESVLAGLLALAISFLAGFAGLGKVADKVMGVINKVRAPIDKALDAVIAWIVTMAKKLFAKIFGKDKKDERTPEQKQADLDKAVAEAEALQASPKASEDSIRKGLGKIKTKYKMKSLELVVDAQEDTVETVHVLGEINPTKAGKGSRINKDGTVGPLGITRKMLNWKADTLKELLKDPIWKKFKGLKGQYEKAGLAIRHKVAISDTIKSTDEAIKPKTPDDAADMLAAKGFPVEGKPKTKPKIISAARDMLQAANNDVSNLFVGDAYINSVEVKESYDPGDKGKASDAEAVAQREAYAEKWGFQDEEFVITIERQSKRRGTTRQTETITPTSTQRAVP